MTDQSAFSGMALGQAPPVQAGGSTNGPSLNMQPQSGGQPFFQMATPSGGAPFVEAQQQPMQPQLQQQPIVQPQLQQQPAGFNSQQIMDQIRAARVASAQPLPVENAAVSRLPEGWNGGSAFSYPYDYNAVVDQYSQNANRIGVPEGYVYNRNDNGGLPFNAYV